MRVVMAALVAAVAITASSCGGGGDQSGESASDAAIRQLGYVDKGQWGPYWDELHPEHQTLVPRDHYINCQESSVPDVSFKDIEVVESYQEDATLPATNVKVSTTAVTLKYKATIAGESRDGTDTLHEVSVDGKWRWGLRNPDAYEDGKCPGQ